MLNMDILVREILPGEEMSVRELFKRNLGPIDRFFFLLAFRDSGKSALKQRGATLVALCEGKVVGSVSLRILFYSGKKIGPIDAIVTEKDLRGRGIGKSLLDEALSWLKAKGCGSVHATADRCNSPSWNMFIHRGFSPYEFPEQIRDLGLNFIRLWFDEFYIVGARTFFLKKTSDSEKLEELGEGRHFIIAWLGLTLLWSILAFREGASLQIVPVSLGIAGLSLFAHEFAHGLVARRFGLKTTFKAWDSGILFSSLLAAIFGAFYPPYGSTYIKQVDWRYNSKRKEIGAIYVSGPTVSLVLATMFWTLLYYASNGLLLITAKMGYVTNLVIALFNLIPIQAAGGFAWDGRKIFTWHKTVWSLLTIGLAILILCDILL